MSVAEHGVSKATVSRIWLSGKPLFAAARVTTKCDWTEVVGVSS